MFTELDRMQRDKMFIQNRIPDIMSFGVMQVDSKDYKKRFLNEIEQRENQTKQAMIEKFQATITESQKLNEVIYEQLSVHYKTVSEYINL